MALERTARRLRGPALVGLAFLLALPGTAAAEDSEKIRAAFLWGLGCSLAADAADFASTVYAHNRRADVAEGNPVYGTDYRDGDLTRPILIKAAGAAAINGTAIYFSTHGLGVWANLLVWGNCAGKIAWTIHNLKIANDAPPLPGAFVGVRLRWR